jgi:hypothetical protein
MEQGLEFPATAFSFELHRLQYDFIWARGAECVSLPTLKYSYKRDFSWQQLVDSVVTAAFAVVLFALPESTAQVFVAAEGITT